MQGHSKQGGFDRGSGRHALHASFAVVLASVSIGSCDACQFIESHVLTADPNPAQVGQEVTVKDQFRVDKNATSFSVMFDLDGDGLFDTPGSLQPSPDNGSNHALYSYFASVEKTYEAPATIQVASLLRAEGGTPFHGESFDVQSETLKIEPQQPGANQPPLASFEMQPNPATPESNITYDASASMDPDGQVVHYEWDLDNDGVFERDEGSNPVFTKLDDGFVRTYTIGLRVTDDDGATATTTRQLVVEYPPPHGLAGREKRARRLAGARTFEFPPKLDNIDPGEFMLNGDELLLVGRTDRGAIPSSPFPASLRHGKRKVRWVSVANGSFDTAANEAHGQGFALLSFPAGGRACLAFKLDVPASGKPAGSFRILGGTGRAKGLRGEGVGTGKLTQAGISARGRLQVDLNGRKRLHLRRSGCAPLLGL